MFSPSMPGRVLWAAGLAAAKLISRRYRSRSWALLLLPPSPAQHQHQVIQSPAQIISLPRVFINDFSDNWMRHRQPVCLVKAGPRIFDWIMVAKYFSLLSILKHVTFFIKYFCTNLYPLSSAQHFPLECLLLWTWAEAEDHYSVWRILCLKAQWWWCQGRAQGPGGGTNILGECIN